MFVYECMCMDMSLYYYVIERKHVCAHVCMHVLGSAPTQMIVNVCERVCVCA